MNASPLSHAQLREAIGLALAGEWAAAHQIIQRDESSPLACWIHGILHRIEGDSGNARYWYGEAGMPYSAAEPADELRSVLARLTAP